MIYDKEKQTVTIKPAKIVIYKILILVFANLLPFLPLVEGIFNGVSADILHVALLGVIIVEIFLSFIAMLSIMQIGRTYIFDKEGLTVCFIFYKKKYTWEELKVKRLDNYKDCILRGYTEGAVFATDEVKRTYFMTAPDAYRIKHLLIPLASPFFIDFIEEGKPFSQQETNSMYQVNKKDFLEAMGELGVKLDCV